MQVINEGLQQQSQQCHLTNAQPRCLEELEDKLMAIQGLSTPEQSTLNFTLHKPQSFERLMIR